MSAKVTLVPADGAQSNLPSSAGAVVNSAFDLSRVYVEVGGSIESIRQEVDDACADMRTFHNREPDQVMRMCAGHLSRMVEVRIRIHRIEDIHRQWKTVRVREVEPLMDALRQQFDIASRLHTVREFDYRLATGDSR